MVAFLVTSVFGAFPREAENIAKESRSEKSPLEKWGLEGFDLGGSFQASLS